MVASSALWNCLYRLGSVKSGGHWVVEAKFARFVCEHAEIGHERDSVGPGLSVRVFLESAAREPRPAGYAAAHAKLVDLGSGCCRPGSLPAYGAACHWAGLASTSRRREGGAPQRTA